MVHRQSTINARGQLLDIARPVVMGVVNVTPDSFFDGGRHRTVQDSVSYALRMMKEGAQIIDIGGMSSRPGSGLIDSSTEIERITPVVEGILSAQPDAIISIDTIHSTTARVLMDLGAHMINDISGGRDDEDIVEVAAKFGAPFICMHMKGMPASMQDSPAYEDVALDVLKYFVQRISVLRNAGIKDIILDPGFGFGKTDAHNYELLGKLGVFKFLELPILTGLSRKSMICRVLKVKPDEALNGTTALHMLALQNGAGILRVHDVKEAREVIKLYEFYKSAQNQNETTTMHSG